MMPKSEEEKKTGKRMYDKVSELLLKKKDITKQKAIHVKNGNIIWQERKWLLVRKVALWEIFFLLFASFHDVILCFQFLKRTKKKRGSTGKHTVGTESSTQMFCVSCIFRDICICARLEKVKLSSTSSPK